MIDPFEALLSFHTNSLHSRGQPTIAHSQISDHIVTVETVSNILPVQFVPLPTLNILGIHPKYQGLTFFRISLSQFPSSILKYSPIQPA
jgi:hypothetical protein